MDVLLLIFYVPFNEILFVNLYNEVKSNFWNIVDIDYQGCVKL